MSRFGVFEGGKWLVTQTLSNGSLVINSCTNYKDAEGRARDLARQLPDKEVTLYKAIEKFSVGRTPVKLVLNLFP